MCFNEVYCSIFLHVHHLLLLAADDERLDLCCCTAHLWTPCLFFFLWFFCRVQSRRAFSSLHFVTPPPSLLRPFSRPTHIYGAAHQRASLQRLPHDVVEVFGRLRQLEELRNATGEILHGFQSVAPFQCLIRPMQPKREVNHSAQCADIWCVTQIVHCVCCQFVKHEDRRVVCRVTVATLQKNTS